MATVNFPTRVQNESSMTIDCMFTDNYKFTKYTIFPIYNGLSDHDAQLLTITNELYGAEHYSRGHQILGHLIVSQHFMEPEGSIPNSQELSTCSHPELDQFSPHHPIPPLHDPS
jgi:hypothetical protein